MIPWEDRKNHKPLYNTKLPPAPIYSVKSGYLKFNTCNIKDVPSGSIVLIGGAGILPPDFVKNNTVINSHCGWLPEVRGLDSLKWAIYYDQPIGCTTHIVDAQCDKGLLIEREEVELEPTDSLFSIAMKQYELEINMLVESVVNERWKYARPFWEPACEPTRRMKHATELQMIKRLDKRLWEMNL
jgi:phosphoribosylglycinamide formyltransferase-1